MNTAPPCGCDSLYSHKATCRLVHPETAALPSGLPTGVEIVAAGRVLRVRPIRNSPAANLAPNNARCLARELLLAADLIEREAGR